MGVDVSVPLRGKGRDQPPFSCVSWSKLLVGFPSPCGEKVGINESPCSRTADTLRRVSVPLRGKGRDQRFIRDHLQSNSLRVSVPLRGKGRDQLAEIGYLAAIRYVREFPSPCGEKVGINLKLVKTEGECYSGFRPLAGKR